MKRFTIGLVALSSTLLVGPLAPVGRTGAAAPVAAPEPGDASRYDTWTGYQSGRYLEGVVSTDLNGDSRPDVAWARQDFFDNHMQVQFNLGDGTLGRSIGYPSQSQSNDIGAADLDRDGDKDLVVISQGDSLSNHIIDLYFNDGSGVFTHQTATGGTGPKKLALADLDGDNDIDLAMTNYWGGNDISVLKNNGNGSFAPETRYTVGSSPNGITAADLDNDGDVDLAVSRFESTTFKVHLLTNNGAGLFTLARTLSINATAGDPVVTSADWDRDGDQDLAVAGQGTDRVYILTNTGGLNFTQSSMTGGYGAFDIQAVDVDADGDADLLDVASATSAGFSVVLFRNTGNGTFGPMQAIEAGNTPHDATAADLTGDGLAEVIVANRITDTGSVHPQHPDGTFAIPPIYQTSSSLPLATTTADFDRDGDIDLAEAGQQIHILLNQGNGTFVSSSSLSTGGGDAPNVYASDLNHDGAPDLVWTPDAPPYPYVYALNNGNGTFGPIVVQNIQTCGTGDAATADVDNDGDQDILVPNNRSGPSQFCESIDQDIRVSLNNGNGTFQPDYGVAVHPLPQVVAGGDMNGDGRIDMVAASSSVSVVFGSGNGLFSAPVTYSNARGTEIKLIDLDADLDLDAVTSDLSTSSSYVLVNDGTGTFSRITNYLSEQISGYADAFAVDVGDVDHDGIYDIVVANPSGNNAGVHYGTGAANFQTEQVRYGTHNCLTDINLADFNGDGQLDMAGPACVGTSFVTPRGVQVLLQTSSTGPQCTITGTEGDDVLRGTAGDDVICGLGGNDTIDAGPGNDTVYGGPGNDLMRGGTGADRLYGEDGNDRIDGLDRVQSNDTVDGGLGSDRCRADTGDTVVSCP